MQNVTYNSDMDTITLQPDVLWEDAIAAVEPYSVASYVDEWGQRQ
jgi:hypothetical protein